MKPIIVVVGGNPGTESGLLEYFDRQGFEVVFFESFLEAVVPLGELASAPETSEAVQLIISELIVAGDILNGLGFLGCLNGLFENAKRVVLSARAEIEAKASSRDYAFVDKRRPDYLSALGELIPSGQK